MGDEDSVDNSEDIQDYSLNTTANLYSLMIMQNYFDPGLVVSPLEPSGNVLIDDDYDWEMYETEGLPWDTNFHVSLNDYDEGCNTSYAHLALCGERRTRKWRNTQSATFPMLSNRGTENGVTSGPQYENSITLKFHAPKDKWTGNVVFADNHVDFLDTFTPEGSVYFRATPESPLQGEVDNIFAAEFDEYDFHLKGNPMFDSGEPSGDAFLVICDTVTKHTVHALYD